MDLFFDPKDAEDWIKLLKTALNILLIMFVIISTIVFYHTLIKVGGGQLPPEPQWWINFRNLLLGG